MRRIAIAGAPSLALLIVCLAAPSAGTAAMFQQCEAVFKNTGCQDLITVTNSGVQVTEDPIQGPYDAEDDALIGIQNNSSRAISSIPLSAEGNIFSLDRDGICDTPFEGEKRIQPAGCVILAKDSTGAALKYAGEPCLTEEFKYKTELPTPQEEKEKEEADEKALEPCAFLSPEGEPPGASFAEPIGYSSTGEQVTGYEGPRNWYSKIPPSGTSGVVDFSPALQPGEFTYFGMESNLTGKVLSTREPNSSVAPTSSSSAGACVPSGQVPVKVSAFSGAKAVEYVLDGGQLQSIATDTSGEATIPLAPGQHTLEFWGEDQTGAQESSHHVLTVTVASSGPSLTITSDQNHHSYEVGEAGSVTITATGPGLTVNPSAAHVPISTAAVGSFSVTRSAADPCGTTEASFTYTVIPLPVLGSSVNVGLVSGKVFIALPVTGQASLAGPLESAFESLSKGLKFIPLIERRQIPVGSVLDTTGGVASIVTATAAKSDQSGDFGAGIFKLLQRRRQLGLTELDIMNNRSASQVCATLGKKAIAAKHLSSKVLGRLNSSVHGKFTTRGQYSAATVRGTIWSVDNQCNGTLTKVTRGVVAVRDFRLRKTITLFAGQQYLAKAP